MGLMSGAVWEPAVGGIHDRMGRKPSALVAGKRRCVVVVLFVWGNDPNVGGVGAGVGVGAAVNNKWV